MEDNTGQLLTLVMVFSAAMGGYVAHTKHRNPIAWALAGLLFGLLPIFALWCLPRVTQPVTQSAPMTNHQAPPR